MRQPWAIIIRGSADIQTLLFSSPPLLIPSSGLLRALVKSSQVKYRGYVTAWQQSIIRALLHAIFSPQPYASYGDLIELGR